MTQTGEPSSICPDCRLALPVVSGTGHPYFGASPACWALYGEVLAREYESLALMEVHRLTVDAYAVQHPGKPERRSIQSVWVHLAGLYLVLECGRSHAFARRLIGALTADADRLAWLPPPERLGEVTVASVAQAVTVQDHREAVGLWARSAWAAWAPHHETVAALAEHAARRL